MEGAAAAAAAVERGQPTRLQGCCVNILTVPWASLFERRHDQRRGHHGRIPSSFGRFWICIHIDPVHVISRVIRLAVAVGWPDHDRHGAG